MKKTIVVRIGAFALITAIHATEFHVAINSKDSNPGTMAAPLRTIQHAADLAQPGDVITVHAGVYRERINPPRGGTSDTKRIVYQAAPGEKVEIKGSEVVKGWKKVQDDVWKVTIPNSFFGGFNPYSDLLRGDWFNAKRRAHHTGAVYLNGDWLTEAAKFEEVIGPIGKTPLWFGQVDNENTTIWAQFKGVNPNEQLIEINVRQTVFYPDQPGRNYITVRGFTMRHAATSWAPPTAEQIGLIGTHWSKGWIIESNTISHSICSGVALGKYGDEWDNRAGSASGYVGTINRALTNGWTKATIGSHIVRDNHISHCEQTGIVGSLGCAFSKVTSNVIHDIHVRQLFGGAEMAGIKFHAAIDTEISHNHIYRTCRGLWLDWMAQGTRVSRNLFHDNSSDDLFVEVNHGPFTVDNNIFLSATSLTDWSEGGAYTHNLFTGKIISHPEPRRKTPYHPAHSTAIAGLANIKGGDNRFHNNILAGPATFSVYDTSEFPSQTSGNIPGTGVKLVDSTLYLTLESKPKTKLVTTDLLGKAKIPNLPYENSDGTPLKINTDYFGKPRNLANPTPGPFENLGVGIEATISVWQ
jgi:alpha-N-arabinofuranosidase